MSITAGTSPESAANSSTAAASAVPPSAIEPQTPADLVATLRHFEAQIGAMLASGRSDLPMDVLWRTLERFELLTNQIQGKGSGGSPAKEVALLAMVFETLAKRPPSLAVDIGANVGDYTDALLQRFAALEVHLFEPSSTNVAALRTRFAGRPGQVRVEPRAVARETGEATLFANTPGSVLGSLTKRKLDHINIDFSSSESIQTVRFEEYWQDLLQRRDIDLVKIDVEGHEFNVLDGFGEALTATRLIQFEFGGTNIDTRTYFQDFWYLLTGAGFELYRITPLGLQKIPRYRENDESFLFSNYLAVNRARF